MDFKSLDGLWLLVSQSLPNQFLADPDVQLMLRVVRDDTAAFEQLVQRYQSRLIGFFYQLMRDRNVAEDMAQEVFLRIYRARESYSAKARFSTWVFRIAHNLASNKRRNLAHRKEIQLAASTDSSVQNTFSGEILAEKSALMPTRQIDTLETRSIVRDAVDSLNERQKTVILLHKFQGMSYEEIGNVMDLNVVAVKSLIARARCKLKEALERHV